jgi:hypothetical protein
MSGDGLSSNRTFLTGPTRATCRSALPRERFRSFDPTQSLRDDVIGEVVHCGNSLPDCSATI